MRKKVGIIKRVLCLCLIFLLSINSFAAIVSDNDGSAFITKAEFDALKSSFQSQIDSYNQSIDSKIDGAIASYLAGIKLSKTVDIDPLPGANVKWKIYGSNDIAFVTGDGTLCQYENNIGYPASYIVPYNKTKGKDWDSTWGGGYWANFTSAGAVYFAQPTSATNIMSDTNYDTQTVAVANVYKFNGSNYYFLDKYATKNTIMVKAAGNITPYYWNIITMAPYNQWKSYQTEFENKTRWTQIIGSTCSMQTGWTTISETTEIKTGTTNTTVFSGTWANHNEFLVNGKYWNPGVGTSGKFAVNFERKITGAEDYQFLLNRSINLPLAVIDVDRKTTFSWPTDKHTTPADQTAVAISYGEYTFTTSNIEAADDGTGGAPSIKVYEHAYYAIALPHWNTTDTSAETLYNQKLTELLNTPIKCTDGLPILRTGKKGTYKVTLKVTKTTGTNTYANLKLSSTPFGTGYSGGTNIPYKISGTTTTQVPYGSQQVLEFDFEEENKVIYLQLQDKTKTDSGAIVEIISIEETLED